MLHHLNLAVTVALLLDGARLSGARPAETRRVAAQPPRVTQTPKAMHSRPFMEHPTGQFQTAIAAMEDAIVRLRRLPQWDAWITFTAQGRGGRADSYHLAEVRLRQGSLKVGGGVVLDVRRLVRVAQVSEAALVRDGDVYSVAKASPAEVARLLDAVFRHHLGIKPFPDEGNDYAVGAEWEEPQGETHRPGA